MRSRAFNMISLCVAALVVHLVLVQPNHPAALTPGAALLFPLELPALVLAMIALRPGTWFAFLCRVMLVCILMALVVLKLADFGMFTAFNRAFNPMIDMHLIAAGWNLGSGAVGVAQAVALVCTSVVALVGVAWALWWALGRWQQVTPGPGWHRAAVVGSVLAASLAIAEIGQAMRVWALPAQPPGAAFTARVAVERATTWRGAIAELRAFRRAASTDPFADATGLFDQLAGRDITIVFLESYGRTSFDNPLYSATHLPTLRAAQTQLADAGLVVRSGWLTSPISGGQSWLAHGTLASGMMIGDQIRYGALLGSPRGTIFDLARKSGYHTAAVMPAITMPWPEAELLGFDTVIAASGMGYRGLPFNWVTMPDQFTLASYPALLPKTGAPLLTQIALISSHAPWVPVPTRIDWNKVGDGSVFDVMAVAGDPPAIVWRDHDRVRDQYRQSIDYVLRMTTEHMALQSAERKTDMPLMIILGDHAPTAFVSQIGSLDVPIHLVGPPEAVALFDAWNWTPGMVPDTDLPAWPMSDFRNAFLRAVTSAPPPAQSTDGGS